jgi:hypothetical protein
MGHVMKMVLVWIVIYVTAWIFTIPDRILWWIERHVCSCL